MLVKVFLLSLLLLLTGCMDQPIIQNHHTHAVENRQLRLLMHELDTVAYERAKSELERDDMRRRYAMDMGKKIEKLAEKLETFAFDEQLPATQEDDRHLFRRYAHNLYLNGEAIYKAAEAYELEKLPGSIQAMRSSCDACHERFRNH